MHNCKCNLSRLVHFNRGRLPHIWMCLACAEQLGGPKLPEEEREALAAFGNILNERTNEMGKEIKLAIQIVVGDTPVSAEDIATALRAQAEALSPEHPEAETPSKKKPAKGGKKKENGDSRTDFGGTEADDPDSSEGSDGDDAGSSEADDPSGEESGSSEDDGGFGGESSEPEESGGPSKEECIGLLKKLAAKSSKDAAMKLMKKVTGKDSIHDVADKHYAALHKAVKAAIKA